MIAMLLAAGVAMTVTLIGTPLLIRWQHAAGIGEEIRDELIDRHAKKAGTPTFGGLMVVAAFVIGYLIAHVRPRAYFTRGGLLVIAVVIISAAVGFLDDWLKVRYGRKRALNKRAKLAGQLIAAGTFAFLAVRLAGVHTTLAFTRHDSLGFDLGTIGWVAFAMLLIIGTTNGVNFADGLDGLAAGSSIFPFSAFAMIAFWQFRHPEFYEVPQALDFALVASAMTGAITGFLWWNAAPARIIMGDTGALAIGAGMAGLALVMNLHLLLAVIGAIFVLESLSVIIQIISRRVFNRYFFRMAPIHNHFELLGWPETTVVVRFWILGGICTAMSVALFYADFLAAGGVD